MHSVRKIPTDLGPSSKICNRCKSPTTRQRHSAHVETIGCYLSIGRGCHTSVITNDYEVI